MRLPASATRTVAILAALSSLLTAGCAQRPGTQTPGTQAPDNQPAAPETESASTPERQNLGHLNHLWVLDQATIGGKAMNLDVVGPVDLEFGDATLRGQTGCGAYVASFEAKVSGEMAITKPGVSTLVCDAAVAAWADRYLGALRRVTSWQVDTETASLALTGPDIDLQFAQVPDPNTPRSFDPDESSPYAGQWRLLDMTIDNKPVDLLDGVEVTLRLWGMSATGNAGCNDYGLTIRAASDMTIALAGLAIGARLCSGPAGLQKQESAYAVALSGVQTWTVDDAGILQLAGSGAVLRYEPLAAATTPSQQPGA